MEQLLEDYSRRLETLATEIEKSVNAEKITRLNIKASCYRTFISELKKILADQNK
jgi:hypothetical protein